MSTAPHQQPTAASVLMQARATVDELHDRLWAAVDDLDLVDVEVEIAALRAELASIEAAALVELDVRRVPRRQLQWASTADWLAHTAGLTRGQAKRTLQHAHDLLGERHETRAALRAATLSPTQAAVICDGIQSLPSDRMLRRRAEVVLLHDATRLDATDLATAARRILDIVDPDREDRRIEAELAREERAAHLGRFLSISDDGAGGVRVKGRGSVEDAAVLRAALLPLTAPAPKPAPTTDPRTGEATGQQDLRDHGARTWDALVELAQHGLDTELPPASHGTPTRVSVTIPVGDLLAGLGRPVRSGRTDDGLDLHPAVVRRLACDAEIIPVVLGTAAEVLDVGRAHRTATPAIWRALVVRDRHCAFPGCSRPPIMCHAHHVVHWVDGGETSLANLVLLCGAHHRTIHHTPWRVRLGADRHPEFLPPPRHRTDVEDPDGGSAPDSDALGTTDDAPSVDPVWIRHRSRGDPCPG